MSAVASPVSSPVVLPWNIRTVSAGFMDTNKAAKVYEELVAHLYKDEYDETILAPNRNFPDWDIKFKKTVDGVEKITTYEVKADFKANTTGNICVEFETKANRLHVGGSGLTRCRATFWVHFIHDYDPDATQIEFFIIPTKVLRRLVKENMFREIWGGNEYSSHCYLIPYSMKEIQKYSHILKLSDIPEEFLLRMREIPVFEARK